MKSKNQDPAVAVVIPIYKSALNALETVSLKQCMKVLGRYPVRIVKPESLDLQNLKEEFPSIEFISFEDYFFKDIDSYNRLMISR